jgi:hypothetical protein
MFHTQKELEDVASDIFYSNEEIHSELCYKLENLDFDFKFTEDNEVEIIFH